MLVALFVFRSLPLSPHFDDFGAEMGWTARSLATGQGFSSPFLPLTGPTALMGPLFPMLLAGIFKVFGLYSNASAFVALAANSLLSSLTAIVLLVGLTPCLGARTARVAAWMWVAYPYSIYFSAVYLWDCALTSFLFTCCFVLALSWLPRGGKAAWAWYGLLYGLTVLSNPSVLTMVPVLLTYAFWKRRQIGLGGGRPVLLAVVVFCLTLTPWTVRNTRTFHRPILIRDGFWGEFYAGNTGDTRTTNPGWTHPASNAGQMLRYRQLGEIGYMEEKRQLSLGHVSRHPVEFTVVSARRALRFWTGFWSVSRAYLNDQGLDLPNIPLCVAITLVMTSGTWKLYRSSRSLAIPFLLTFGIFPLPYYVTHSSVDYRQPIETVVVAMVAYSVATGRHHPHGLQAKPGT